MDRGEGDCKSVQDFRKIVTYLIIGEPDDANAKTESKFERLTSIHLSHLIPGPSPSGEGCVLMIRVVHLSFAARDGSQ
jgi:hypothetical protein